MACQQMVRALCGAGTAPSAPPSNHHLLSVLAAFCKTQDYLTTYYNPLVTTFKHPKTGIEYRLRLQPDQLLDAAYEFNKVDSRMRDPVRLKILPDCAQTDPACNCPVCARCINERMADGEHAGHTHGWCVGG